MDQFPFGQNDPEHFKNQLIPVINGIQNNLAMILQKIQLIEARLNYLEEKIHEQK